MRRKQNHTFFSPAVLVLPSKMLLFGHFGGSNPYEICLILAVRIPIKLELLWLGFNYVQTQIISQISDLEVEGGGGSFIGGDKFHRDPTDRERDM